MQVEIAGYLIILNEVMQCFYKANVKQAATGERAAQSTKETIKKEPKKPKTSVRGIKNTGISINMLRSQRLFWSEQDSDQFILWHCGNICTFLHSGLLWGRGAQTGTGGDWIDWSGKLVLSQTDPWTPSRRWMDRSAPAGHSSHLQQGSTTSAPLPGVNVPHSHDYLGHETISCVFFNTYWYSFYSCVQFVVNLCIVKFSHCHF